MLRYWMLHSHQMVCILIQFIRFHSKNELGSIHLVVTIDYNLAPSAKNAFNHNPHAFKQQTKGSITSKHVLTFMLGQQ